ncbi:MAG: hypothetical protein OXB86_04665 [Bdellovibrionales bacterium]|nr:hypothetical protein [Bdellovibrionales bacterium]
MKSLTLLLLITSLLFIPSCGKLSLDGDRPRDRGGRDDDLRLNQINKGDINDALSDLKNCAEYEGGPNTFRIFNLFGDVVKQIENCISKAMDSSIGRICEEEKKLDELERRHRNNDRAMDQIDEYRDSLEYLKADAIDQIYVIVDIFDDIEIRLEDEADKEFHSDSMRDILLGGAARLLITSEVGGWTRFFEAQAQTLCGYNVFDDAEDDRDRRRDRDDRRRD